MGKGVDNRKLILVFSLILIFSLFLSISFVSANVFSDFFNKIFGKGQIGLSPQSCQNDWECPVGQNCNTGSCGTPIDCDPNISINFNPRCPAQDVCNPATSKCQQGECIKSSDCVSPFNVCENALCVQKSCNLDTDCPSNTFTQTKCMAGICMQPMCNTNLTACGTVNPILPVSNIDENCMTDGRIDSWPVIQDLYCASDGLWTKVLLNNCGEQVVYHNGTSCTPTYPGVCFNYLCLRKQCVDNSQCSSDRTCNKGLCFKKECSTNNDCSAGKVCSNNLCKECNVNNDCGDGRACINNICNDAQCKSDSNCSFGQVCDSNFQCSLKPCSTDSNCTDGGTDSEGKQRYCFNALGYCSLPQCTGIQDCSYGINLVCNGLECSQTCNSNADCSHGYRSANQYQCVNHICCANGVCPNRENVNNENCTDGRDNDFDGLTDYADSQCASQCAPPKIITPIVIGNGTRRATYVFLNESVKGCCEANQCYYGNGICANNGGIKVSGFGGETDVCSVNGSSAVWCIQGFTNDGNGNCVDCSSTSRVTCSQLGRSCGSVWTNGCQGYLDCGFCPINQICTSDGRCRVKCNSGSDCPDGQICSNGQCFARSCSSQSLPCPSGQICDLSRRECCVLQCSGKTCGTTNGCGGVCAIGSGCTTTTTISCSLFRPCPRIQCFKAPCPSYTCVSNKCVMK